MKIKVNYDFTHFELVCTGDIFEVDMADDQLNACMVFINGSAPGLDHELHDGDTIEFVYGFCGG